MAMKAAMAMIVTIQRLTTPKLDNTIGLVVLRGLALFKWSRDIVEGKKAVPLNYLLSQ
jgi:hypothetical protein